MFKIIVLFVSVGTHTQGIGLLDSGPYDTIKKCEDARPAAVEAFRKHVAQYGTEIISSQCSINGIGGTPILG